MMRCFFQTGISTVFNVFVNVSIHVCSTIVKRCTHHVGYKVRADWPISLTFTVNIHMDTSISQFRHFRVPRDTHVSSRVHVVPCLPVHEVNVYLYIR